MIVSSTTKTGHAQKDGRAYVQELHVDDSGQQYVFEWLSDGKADPDEVLRLRAERLNEKLAATAAAVEIVDGTPLPISYKYFRSLWTDDELQGMDKVDANLDSFGLTDKQIEAQRTTLKNISVSNSLTLTDPAIVSMLDLYVSIGVLNSKRVTEVVGNG